MSESRQVWVSTCVLESLRLPQFEESAKLEREM
jgi:hypothetical protein